MRQPNVEFVSREQSARHVIEAVDRMLAAETLDAAALNTLAARANYADAAWALQNIVRPIAVLGQVSTVVEILHDRPKQDVAPHRFALAIGVREYTEEFFVSYETISAAKAKSENARTVLALLGEIHWQTASRRERAAFALRQLVSTFRSQ